MKRYSHPTSPGIHSTNRRAEPGADCIIKFSIRRNHASEERHKLFGYPDTYDFARGLTLGGHSSPPSSASEA